MLSPGVVASSVSTFTHKSIYMQKYILPPFSSFFSHSIYKQGTQNIFDLSLCVSVLLITLFLSLTLFNLYISPSLIISLIYLFNYRSIYLSIFLFIYPFVPLYLSLMCERCELFVWLCVHNSKPQHIHLTWNKEIKGCLYYGGDVCMHNKVPESIR